MTAITVFYDWARHANTLQSYLDDVSAYLAQSALEDGETDPKDAITALVHVGRFDWIEQLRWHPLLGKFANQSWVEHYDVNRFLKAYYHSICGNTGRPKPSTIERKLCNMYHYSPDSMKGEKFINIAYGYFWADTKDEAKATVLAFLLKKKMDDTYAIVAKENKWAD
jgi:hypothetical protein